MRLLLCLAVAAGSRLVFEQSPGNVTVAGMAMTPPPIVHLVDGAGDLVRLHPPALRVLVQWHVLTYAQQMTGEVETAETETESAIGAAIPAMRSASVPLVNGTANFTGAFVITFARDSLQLAFSLDPPYDGVAQLVTHVRVVAAAPRSIVVLHDPLGGLSCRPFALQPRVAVKDRYNNTVRDLPALRVLASASRDGVGLVGGTDVDVADGIAAFTSLGLNSTAMQLHLRFELLPPEEPGSGDSGSGTTPPDPPPSPPSLHAVAPSDFAPAIAVAVDCHGPPARIALLRGAPLSLHAVDADGLRTTSIDGVELLAFMMFDDGSRQATGRVLRSRRGVWQYTHESDPLGIALAWQTSPLSPPRHVLRLRFEANLTSLLGLPADSNATCCALHIGHGTPHPDTAPDTIASLYVPPLAVARLWARNTGRQGGYGTGDSLELTFARRTDRAGFAIGEFIDRQTLDEFLVFNDLGEAGLGIDAGAYAGVWRDDCTLLVVAGNTSRANTPVTGVFTLSVQDYLHELRDHRGYLQRACVVRSPRLEGTFGAADGLAGRLDPLRATLPEESIRRFIPPADQRHAPLRTGPLAWHPTLAYDVTRERASECDVNYAEPNGLPDDQPTSGQQAESLPPLSFDEATRALILRVVEQMKVEAPKVRLPFTQPPHGMPTDDTHSHTRGDAPSPPPYTPSFARQQQDERAAAAAIGPNGQVQRYHLTLDAREDQKAFGLESG